MTLTSSDGTTVPGQLSADGTTWTATGQLGYKRTLHALGRSHERRPARQTTQTAKFTTASPNNLTMPYLNTRGGAGLVDGATYGVGLVIRVHFDERSRTRRRPRRRSS